MSSWVGDVVTGSVVSVREQVQYKDIVVVMGESSPSGTASVTRNASYPQS